jgi:hypothetical protein
MIIVDISETGGHSRKESLMPTIANRKIPHGQNEARVAFVMRQMRLDRRSKIEKRDEVVQIAGKHLPDSKPQKIRNLIANLLKDPERVKVKAKQADIN